MKFEEYLDTLPKNVLSGEDVQLPEKTFREIFKFAALGKEDTFYHLGCHDEKGIEIANKEFNVNNLVLVGAPSSEDKARKLKLSDTYNLYNEQEQNEYQGNHPITLGGVTIAERHHNKKTEHLRLMEKAEQG